MRKSSIKFVNTVTKQPISKVLLVDDNQDVLNLNIKYLNDMKMKFEGIRCVSDSYGAMNEIVNNGFDLIILDMHFRWNKRKFVDGLDLVNACRDANKKIIITSRRDYRKKIEKELGKKIDDIRGIEYLFKPYDFDEFSQTIKKIAKARKRSNEQVFKDLCKQIDESNNLFFNKHKFFAIF